MKFITIDKKNWAKGIEKSRETYRLFGPVKDKNGSFIRDLENDMLPDMSCHDSVLSVKSVLFPQTEKILFTTLDESKEDHHIMKRVPADTRQRAVVGIQPYDARAIQLVKLNFDTDDYRDPYWCDAYEATTFVGVGINKPGPFDFSTSAGTGPFSETGLDVLMADLDNAYLAKVLTDKGGVFMTSCGFDTVADEKESQALFDISIAPAFIAYLAISSEISSTLSVLGSSAVITKKSASFAAISPILRRPWSLFPAQPNTAINLPFFFTDFLNSVSAAAKLSGVWAKSITTKNSF